jgi:hypothetical protein
VERADDRGVPRVARERQTSFTSVDASIGFRAVGDSVMTARPGGNMPDVGIDLWWLPLGAGGRFVRMNGRIYEAIQARRERRVPLDLYHTALEVHVPEGRFVIENAWPIPDADGPSRGVVIEGPVGSRRMTRFRPLRYEVRRWRDGIIFDAQCAVASPQRLTDDTSGACRILELVDSLPAPVWGRDELGTGEMWNSNSVISWLLARTGLPMDQIRPPEGGRAPGWHAGLIVARRMEAPQGQTCGQSASPRIQSTGTGAVSVRSAWTTAIPATTSAAPAICRPPSD